MKRLAAALAVLGLALGAAPAAQAAPEVRLASAGTTTDAHRTFRLTLPSDRTYAGSDIKVTEDGDPVSGVELIPGDSVKSSAFGVVLVIDASASMARDRAIDGAVAAARELARQRHGAQRIGIIAFNERTQVLLAPTADSAAIEQALSSAPALAPQTHLFDAIDSALGMLKQSRVAVGSIVLLSDGGDTGSTVPAPTVARRARLAHVPIYTVGLRSGAASAAELQRLAAASGGRSIAAASVAELQPIFRDLGAQLAGDYLLRYRSKAAVGSQVTVAVRLPDGILTTTYGAPGHRPSAASGRTFWTSGAALAVTVVGAGILIALALCLLLVRRARPQTPTERIRGFVSPDHEFLVTRAYVPPAAVENRGTDGRHPRWDAFILDVEIGGIRKDPGTIVLLTAGVTLLAFVLLVALSGILPVGLLALGIPWAVRAWVRLARARQCRKFTDQLPDVLQGASSAVRSGSGLVAALNSVADEAPEPARTEFRRVLADEALGVPLEEALKSIEVRMRSRDILQIALVSQIQRESGGNIAEVLDRITEAMRQRGELRRMVSALTAQGRLSRWVVSALPVGLLVVMSVLNPTYVKPLFTQPLGIVMLLVAGGMMAAGSMVIGKIVDFQV